MPPIGGALGCSASHDNVQSSPDATPSQQIPGKKHNHPHLNIPSWCITRHTAIHIHPVCVWLEASDISENVVLAIVDPKLGQRCIVWPCRYRRNLMRIIFIELWFGLRIISKSPCLFDRRHQHHHYHHQQHWIIIIIVVIIVIIISIMLIWKNWDNERTILSGTLRLEAVKTQNLKIMTSSKTLRPGFCCWG